MRTELDFVKTYRFYSPTGMHLKTSLVRHCESGRHAAHRARVAKLASMVVADGGTVQVSWVRNPTSEHMREAAQRRWESSVCNRPGYEGV